MARKNWPRQGANNEFRGDRSRGGVELRASANTTTSYVYGDHIPVLNGKIAVEGVHAVGDETSWEFAFRISDDGTNFSQLHDSSGLVTVVVLAASIPDPGRSYRVGVRWTFGSDR